MKNTKPEEMVMCDTCQKECEARLMGPVECVYCEDRRQQYNDEKYKGN